MADGNSQVADKICTKCQQLKPLSAFSKQIDGPYGRRSACKVCCKSSDQKYHEKNTERRRIYRKEYHEQNKTKVNDRHRAWKKQQRGTIDYTFRGLLTGARSRAKRSNLPFDLTLEWLESMFVSHCPITLQPLDWGKEEVANGKAGPNSPSIDKIIPELGYVKSNCAIISYRGNRIKTDGTIDEHRRVVQYMAAQQLRDVEF